MSSSHRPHHTALVAVADGSEDIETVTTVDVLRRAGITVDLASVAAHNDVTLARGTKITADYSISKLPRVDYDVIVCPGGMPGAEHLAASETLIHMLQNHKRAGKYIAAICASPAKVFKAHGLLTAAEPATCYPSFQKDIENKERIDEEVVVTGNVITSQGPGTTVKFALTIVQHLCGLAEASKVADGLLVPFP